ncbi:MAG TPA: outer membrane beta-barrel protein [Gemmatimonadaceae bacterium]|nr:outer membrane beta-barrel protein [Gemmatimonadaceae bacterium]
MNRNFVAAATLALGLALSASVGQAQRSTRRFPTTVQTIPSPSITPYGGYMVFGDIADGPLSTNLTSKSAPVFGAQVNMPLGSVVSVVGNLAYSQPDLAVGIPILGGLNVGQSKIWMYDAGLQLSAPLITAQRSITPFVQAGAGGMHYNVTVEGLSRSASNLAFNAGVGADLPLGQNLGLRIMAKDYIGKFDFNEATSLDYSAKSSNNFALSAGLKLTF